MEVGGFLSGFSSTSKIPSIKPSPTPFSSASSRFLVPTHNPVSFKTHHHQTSPSQLPLLLEGSLKIPQCVKSGGKEAGRSGVLEETDGVVRRKKLAVFVSGGGSNFKSIHQAYLRGSVNGDIVVLVTNNPGCGGAEYAWNKEIPVILFPITKDEQMAYLQVILWVLFAFGGKGYYGMNVHKAVIASGARYSGPTVHFVDEHYDTGHILAQKVVSVLANDTAEELAARVLHQEHQLYVEVMEAMCEERIEWREDGVPLIQSRENPDKYS